MRNQGIRPLPSHTAVLEETSLAWYLEPVEAHRFMTCSNVPDS